MRTAEMQYETCGSSFVARIRSALVAIALATSLSLIVTSTSAASQTAPPVLGSPTAEDVLEGGFEVTYTLPERALAGSVELLFDSEADGVQALVLQNAEAGTHTVEVQPLHPATATGVQSGPAELPTGFYTLSVAYQDELGDPIAASTPIHIRLIRSPLCSPGKFSESGQSPCDLAPPGHYAEGEGSTVAAPCEPGTFAAFSGSEKCVPAPPGSYVDVSGASSAAPCPPGSYSSESGSITCKTTPTNSYSAAGASEPTPCPAGTESPAGAAECTPIPTKAEASGSKEEASGPKGEASGSKGTPASEGSSAGQASEGTQVGAGNSPGSGAGAGTSARASLEVAGPRRQPSLERSAIQRFRLSSSVTGSVLVSASVTIVLAHKRVKLYAQAVKIKCRAGRVVQGSVRLKLTHAARRLLAKHHARVILHLRARERTSSGTQDVVSKRLTGRR